MDLHVFLYDGIARDWVEIKFQAPTPSTRRWGSRKSTQVRDKDPADRDAASDVGCYFTVGDQTFTSDILLNTNEPNFRTFFEFDCQAKDAPSGGGRDDLKYAPLPLPIVSPKY